MTYSRQTTSAVLLSFFFFNDTATTEIYTLSLHDALPISSALWPFASSAPGPPRAVGPTAEDRKSTRLNSSHVRISYAVFCLKKKKNMIRNRQTFAVRRTFRLKQPRGSAT